MRPEAGSQPDDALRPLHEMADEYLGALLVAGNHDALRVIFKRYYGLAMRVWNHSAIRCLSALRP